MTPRNFPVLLRRRTATTAGAITLGLVALAFAWSADQASKLFELLVEKAPYAPLLVNRRPASHCSSILPAVSRH